MSGEIIIDSKRKRSWPKDLKRQIVAESDAPDVTVCEVARRYDIEPSQLFHWRKQFRDESAKAADFLPVELTADQAGSDDDEPEYISSSTIFDGVKPKPVPFNDSVVTRIFRNDRSGVSIQAVCTSKKFGFVFGSIVGASNETTNFG